MKNKTNYVKIKANSPCITYSLFVKESDTSKVLLAIREKHMQTREYSGDNYSYYGGWKDNNHLTVSMRRVILPKNKSSLVAHVVKKSLEILN